MAMADSVRSGSHRTEEAAEQLGQKIAATPVGTGGSGPLLPLPPSRPPARGRVVNPDRHPAGSPAEPTTDPLLRFLGFAALLTVPVGLTLLAVDGATHDAAHLLAGYSPERLAHGALWTLPLAALVLPHVRMIGPTTVFIIVFLLPYALLRGPVRALVVFFAGHLVATLTVGVAAIAVHLAGWSGVDHWYRHVALGPAAGLAAVVGGLAGVVVARSRPAGVVVAAVAAGSLLIVPATHPGVIHDADAAQRLLALAIGLLIELHWSRTRANATELAT
jgi:hypothetical protein